MTLLARDLRFGYADRGGGFALEVPRISVERGDVVAVLGPNGAGKSTLLRILGGLLSPFEGTVSLDGERLDPADPDPVDHRRRIGFVFARPARFRGTALDNAAAALVARGVARRRARETAAAWLERLGVAGRAGAPASILSDGELQRVALARALAPEPDFLLLDEPFARFDPPTRAAWADEIGRLAAEGKRGVLLVTHEPREAARLAKRMLILDRGRSVQEGTPEDLRARPAAAVVTAVLGNH